MKILAFDASTEALSVALFDSARDAPPVEIFEIAPRAHAARLLPAAHTLLAEAELSLTALDGLAFARGPGAFTGLRIAAGLVQGLALGSQRPVLGISTLAALAYRGLAEVAAADTVQVVQDARMGEIYTAIYTREDLTSPFDGERVIAPEALVIHDTPGTIRAGNGWTLVPGGNDMSPAVVSPHAGDIARLAAPRFAAGQGGPAHEAVPVYVRDDVARRPAAP